MEEAQKFQAEPGKIHWKMKFRSSPKKVYQALSTDAGRKKYWAESADEIDGEIHYVFLNGIEDMGEILEREPENRFVVMYFGWKVTFELTEEENGGTDMHLCCEGVSDEDKPEISSGWVSWLMAMKAAVDFDVDLRNHDASRTWFQGYADN